MKRIKLGIEGLDKMVGGGFPANKVYLVAGTPGTGKTLISFEFLYRGGKLGEKGLFLSMEEEPDEIIENVSSTFSELQDVEKIANEMMTIVKIDETDLEKIMSLVEEKIVENEVKRVVFDSASILRYMVEEEKKYRKIVSEFFHLLKGLNTTVFVTFEERREERIDYGIEHFVADGVIELYNIKKDQTTRINALEILKMRGASHSKNIVPFKITKRGIKVYPEEKIF